MPSAPQLPAELHTQIVAGDAWEISVDFDFDVTDYTFAAHVTPRTGDAIAMTVTVVDATAGQITVLLSSANSATLQAGEHQWCLVLTPPYTEPALPRPRTFLRGRFVAKDC
jgi:hypothetical protein